MEVEELYGFILLLPRHIIESRLKYRYQVYEDVQDKL